MKAQHRSTKNSFSKAKARDLFGALDHQVNWRRVYCVYFQTIFNSKSIRGIDCKKLSRWIENSLKDRIQKRYACETYSEGPKTLCYDEIAYFLTNDILVCLDTDRDIVELLFSEADEDAHSLFETIKKFKKKSSALSINLIVTDRDGMSLKDLKTKKLCLQLNENYNEDLCLLHPTILSALKKESSNGLVLFHGDPGTGKSTYIRYLVGFLKKKVIFLSPRLAGNLDDPGFARLLTENPNSIVIIEDAEALLISRDGSENSGISTLLNLTDGLLGTSLGIQFICTFNTPASNIDKALLRKGRLVALYQFGPLSIAKSTALLQRLGIADFRVTQPMSLAEIYNVEKPQFRLGPKKQTIGFKASAA